MAEKLDKRPLLVIVTGLSGAGLSTVLATLQDNGFYSIDNLPFQLVDAAVESILQGSINAKGFAFGMDIRDKRFALEFPKIKEALQQRLRLDVLFLFAEKQIIANRYSSTRRAHPLIGKRGDLTAAIEKERAMLLPVRKSADVVLDTSVLSPHMLARKIEERYQAEVPPRSLYVTITSFGFKHGQLRPCDEMIDVRFLPNPYFVPDLRSKTGLDGVVREYIGGDVRTKDFLKRLDDLHRFLLPHYLAEGKHYFNIGIGCTGGKHRSVFVSEWLAKQLQTSSLKNVIVNVVHRDIDHAEPRVLQDDY